MFRHPKQLRRLCEFSSGKTYTLVVATPAGAVATPVLFAGRLNNSDIPAARRAIDTVAPPDRARRHLTFHIRRGSGWTAEDYALWLGYDLADAPGFDQYGPLKHLLDDGVDRRNMLKLSACGILPGHNPNLPGHRLVVPMRDWEADPRLHAADWMPERARGWAEEETRLRAKRDEAMRRALGFG